MKIKLLLPKTKYELEALLKSFGIYFISIAVLITLIFYLNYKNTIQNHKHNLFLEMKNFSLTFKGNKFQLDLVQNKKQNIYELQENQSEFFIYVPIPFSEQDLFKISYKKEKFFQDIKKDITKLKIIYVSVLAISLIMSIAFAFYSLYPIRKALNILDETIKDIIHDINTPVMSILVNIKLLKMKYKDEDVDRLELAVNQLKNIYENLKTALKETEKNVKQINLKSIIEKEIKTISTIYPDINYELNIENTYITADENAVQRIIFNLISNAFKHNTKNGYVKINLKNLKLEIENSSPKIKNPDKLFDRYYKESQRGIGIGLSIVKKLVNQLGWKIEIITNDSKFKVILFIK